MAMRKTTVQIDEALLTEAIEAIGAFSFSSSPKKTPRAFVQRLWG
jgi:Arc/MetJ family transcription regulator